jgi:CBS domain-containing protein
MPVTAVEQVMRPPRQLRVVSPDVPVMRALETMAQENIKLPVTSDGRIESIISRAHLLEIFRTRAELKV